MALVSDKIIREITVKNQDGTQVSLEIEGDVITYIHTTEAGEHSLIGESEAALIFEVYEIYKGGK